MADTFARRPARKSVTAASSPAVADLREADSTGGRGFPAVGIAINKKGVPDSVTPSRPSDSTFLSDHSRGSRPSIGSKNSSSATGSSIKSDKVFDTPLSSPACDSNPTSPEEDTTPIYSKATPSKRAPRPRPRRTGDNFQEPIGSEESPAFAAEKRKKASTKYRVTPLLPKEASRPSIRLEPPVTERRRSSSAPSVASPTRPGSSEDDPIILSDDDHLVSGIKNLTLKEGNDATTSPRTRRASSRTFGKLAAEPRGRASSASGRVEERATNKAETSNTTSELDDMSYESMDWDPTNATSLHTVASNSYAVMEGNRQAGQPTLPAKSSIAGAEKLANLNDTPKDLPAPPNSSLSSTVRTSKPTLASLLAERGEVKDNVEIKEYITPRKSSSVDNRPSEILQDGSGSGFDGESEVSYLTDADSVSTADAERRDPDDEGSESDEESELSDPGDSEPETSLELSYPDDARPNSDAGPEASAVPAADSVPRYPDFRNYSRKLFNDKDIKFGLVRKLKGKIPKPKPKKEKGEIYVYSAPACPGHFKAGSTSNGTPNRVDQQKNCGLGELLRAEDPNQREFRYAKFVENLVKFELRNVRRKFTCKNCKGRSGGPRVHEEWYEIEPERLLRVIEKWRGWITKSDPYNSEGILRPRWIWKLAILDQDNDGVDLDHVLRPFTFVEKLSRRWDWIVGAWNGHFDQYEHTFRAVTDLILVTALIWAIFIHMLGWRVGSGVFIGSSVLLLNYLSWR
jgi:hypothetical protein